MLRNQKAPARRWFGQGSGIACATSFFFLSTAVGASEIKVLASSAMIPIMRAVVPDFENQSGNKVSIRFLGTNLKTIIEGGEFFDLAISQPDVIDELIQQNKIVAGSNVAISRQGLAVGMRAGAAKPDIGSAEAFKKTILGAKAVTYPGEGRAGVFVSEIFERLGIADEMKRKSILFEIASGPRSVIDGEADFVITTVGTIRGNSGLELAGPLPAELQVYSILMGGIGAAAKETQPAKALLMFLTSPPVARSLQSIGMEPIQR